LIKIFAKMITKMFPGKPPKYRLVPQEDERYSLERYHSDLGIYLCEDLVDSKEEADAAIANLERETIYYREKT